MESSLTHMVRQDRMNSIVWAQDVLDASDWVLIDTETTGLSTRFARVVEVAIVSPAGVPIINTLIDPGVPIPNDASKIHGITDAMVKGAPSIGDVWELISASISGKKILCYNVDYDQKILECEANRKGLPLIENQWECVMLKYADFVGEPGFGRYRYQKLPSAGHRALDDCLATIDLIRLMARA